MSAATPALRDQLFMKRKILLELQQKKLELELMKTKVILQEQQKQITDQGTSSVSYLASFVLVKALKALFNLVFSLSQLAPAPVRPISEEAAKLLLSQRAVAKPKAVVMPPSTMPVPKPVSQLLLKVDCS